ncbi:acetylcholine receptor subunit alpha-like 1 [Caerostris extrusa]|uniref:Acetylcholine receptor subunit alpha-like 1 n=1 Tax=Caerostris extrusa TaxID=172846 RepID=A0AAV4SUP7_CAEEX|nr:acetylcholine receptor subunit alpha-like 1 [Caerostris extrusa]
MVVSLIRSFRGTKCLLHRCISQYALPDITVIGKIESDWQYVAMVLDRLFLWIFTIACVVGTGWIILCAPSLYDDKQPIDIVFSKSAPNQKIAQNLNPPSRTTSVVAKSRRTF